MDIQNTASFTDYFVICTGTSDRMLDALAKYVHDEVKKNMHFSKTPEGHSENGWVVLDLGGVVVHFFSPDQRKYYRLEELWNTGKVVVKLA